MRLFISYAHADRTIVEDWIVNKLRSGGHDVWFDDHLVVGQDWKAQLEAEIRRSDALVYAMTPESVASEWCLWEVARAAELGKPVIPVLVQQGTQPPAQLGNLQYVDFSKGATGDAVARLMGGLQQLSPAQIPLPFDTPKGVPAQAVPAAGEKSAEKNRVLKALRDPAIQAIIGIVGIALTILFALNTRGNETPAGNGASPLPPTPATPVVSAIRDLDIRSGPGATFDRLNTLSSGSGLDILGISEDRLWYQVLLTDGTTGWVLAAESGAAFAGDRSVLHVIVPTIMATPVINNTPVVVPTLTPTSPPPRTPIVIPTFTPAPPSTSYLCTASITTTRGDSVRQLRKNGATDTNRSLIQGGLAITILGPVTGPTSDRVYHIGDANGAELGWISVDYVVPGSGCPTP